MLKRLNLAAVTGIFMFFATLCHSPITVGHCRFLLDWFVALCDGFSARSASMSTAFVLASNIHQFTNMNSLPFSSTRQALDMPCFVA